MVAEQRETVQRIDADTQDIMSNVGGAQRELLKYYASISSNRWLMLKVFGVLIVFVRVIYFGRSSESSQDPTSSWFSSSYHDFTLEFAHSYTYLYGTILTTAFAFNSISTLL